MTTRSRPTPSRPVQAPRTRNGPYQPDPTDIRRPACGIEWRSARPSHPVCAWLIGQLPIVRSIRAGTGRGGPPRRHHGSAWSWPQRDHATGSYGWDSHVRDLLEIADLRADSFDVIGHSMGGFIGMSLAAQYPRRCSRLVLIDASASLSPALCRPSPNPSADWAGHIRRQRRCCHTCAPPAPLLRGMSSGTGNSRGSWNRSTTPSGFGPTWLR